MKFTKSLLTGTCAVVLAGAVLTVVAPQAAHAIAAALVVVTNTTANPVPTAPAVPGTPFFGYMQLSGNDAQSVGPGTGTLGVSQIVITNLGSTLIQVNVFAALLNGGTCGGTGNVSAATNPFMIVKVPGDGTVVVPAPTPLVFTPRTGYDSVNHTCVAASMPITGGSAFVTVNGFVN